MSAYVLGVSGLYHDSAAALIGEGGRIVCAAEEERFTRHKHDARFPARAIAYCLGELPRGATLAAAVFYEDETRSFDRVLKNAIDVAPEGADLWSKAARSMLGSKIHFREFVHAAVPAHVPVFSVDHHLAHAASAFYPSPFEEAALLVADGVGEWATTSIGAGRGSHVELSAEIRYPHSLGLLYSAFTYYCGFKVNSGEYKLMGLAPYGTPRFAELIRRELIDLRADGSYRLNLAYFGYLASAWTTNPAFESLFGGPPRAPEAQITRREMDLAASVQVVLEEAVMRLAAHAKRVTGMSNLCMSGGVALNCVANGKLSQSGLFDRLWIQPAASDAGGAIGAALLAYHECFAKGERTPDAPDGQHGSLLGPAYSSAEVRTVLDRENCAYEHVPDDAQRRAIVAQAIAAGNVVGYYRGRMEFGPRALGARSILADPRREDAQSSLNLKVKFRESWRPFAAAVLAEDAHNYFTNRENNPYMLLICAVREERRAAASAGDTENLLDVVNRIRSDIPAVTHVDYSTRIQSISREDNPDFYELISEFKRLTGYGLVINTSLNVRGEPIICTPEEAYRCFVNTGIDVMMIEDCILRKIDQPEILEPAGVPYALD